MKKKKIIMDNLNVVRKSVILTGVLPPFNRDENDRVLVNPDYMAFRRIATKECLTQLMRNVFSKKISFADFIKNPSHPQQLFSFENGIDFAYDQLYPTPRLTIGDRTEETSFDNLRQIFEQMIDDFDDIKQDTFGIGINIEFVSETSVNILKSLLKEDVQDQLMATKIVLQYSLLDAAANFTLALYGIVLVKPLMTC